MKFSHWFYDNLYFQNFYFLVGMNNDEVSKYIKTEAGVEYELRKGVIDGRCIEVTNDDGQHRIFIIIGEYDSTTRILCALAHECLHAANKSLLKTGVGVDLENDEAQTYYMGWIMRNCLEKIADEKEKTIDGQVK